MNDFCSLKVEYSHEVCYPPGNDISNGAEREREREKRETETESSGDGPNCDVVEEKA
jgi:hypothetical protein